MTNANSWGEPLRSLDSTEAQGLTTAWYVSTKILQAFGSFILLSSVRHSVEAASTSRRPGLGFAFAEVRTRQALCNRIQPVECCRRTLGTALASRTTRWKSI